MSNSAKMKQKSKFPSNGDKEASKSTSLSLRVTKLDRNQKKTPENEKSQKSQSTGLLSSPNPDENLTQENERPSRMSDHLGGGNDKTMMDTDDKRRPSVENKTLKKRKLAEVRSENSTKNKETENDESVSGHRRER